ncbi:hypothetical protein OG292_34120 [Streptomyces sp. NBC_01511]
MPGPAELPRAPGLSLHLLGGFGAVRDDGVEIPAGGGAAPRGPW